MKKTILITIIALGISSGLISCQKQQTDVGDMNKPPGEQLSTSKLLAINHISGVDIFKAVFFADGRAAKLVNDKRVIAGIDLLKSKSLADYIAYTKVQEEVVAQIQKNSPAFFENFRSLMTSGLPQNVEDALGQATEKMADAVGFSPRDFEALSDPALSSDLIKLKGKSIEEKKKVLKGLLKESYAANANKVLKPAYATQWYYLNYYVAGAYIAIAAAAVLVVVIFAEQLPPTPVKVIDSSEELYLIPSPEPVPATDPDPELKPIPGLGSAFSGKISTSQYFSSSDQLTKDEYVKNLTIALK